MDQVRKGRMPWTKLDVLLRMILEDVLVEFKIAGLTEEEKDRWDRAWHRLKPWHDSVPGLTRLKKKYVIAALSHGNVALLTCPRNWPSRTMSMLCAAHSGDLSTARGFELRTGFIHRPNERGTGGRVDNAKPGEFDLVSKDMLDLATQLGA